MRDDVLHKLTTRLADCYGIIGIEDLNLQRVAQESALARSFSDAALGKLLAPVDKQGGAAWWTGDQRWDASSPPVRPATRAGGSGKRWSCLTGCFICQNPTCAYYQFAQDRDYNAALNILHEALRLIGLIDQAVTGTGSDELRHVTWQSITDAISI